jgi:hypothetical protein
MRLANLSLLFLMTSSIFQFHVSEFREDASQDPITNEMIEEIRASSRSLLYKASCGENNCDGQRDITRGATQGRSTDRSSCRRPHWEVRFWFVAGAIAEVTSMPFSIHLIHLARTEMLVAEANNISVSNAPCLSFVCKFRELLRNVPQNGW